MKKLRIFVNLERELKSIKEKNIESAKEKKKVDYIEDYPG